MSRMVFLDTSGWFAALDRRDARHAAAAAVNEDLLERRTPLLTSNLVLAEIHALVLRRRGPDAARLIVEAVYHDRRYTVRYVDRDTESAALTHWIQRYRDQRFTLADAVSFEIMRQEGIKTAFALDRHFSAAGFDLLPG